MPQKTKSSMGIHHTKTFASENFHTCGSQTKIIKLSINLYVVCVSQFLEIYLALNIYFAFNRIDFFLISPHCLFEVDY